MSMNPARPHLPVKRPSLWRRSPTSSGTDRPILNSRTYAVIDAANDRERGFVHILTRNGRLSPWELRAR